MVIVSCSCFAPTPSMAAMLVNRFKLREDVLTYNMSGMGCSTSVVAVDLAKHLLTVGSRGLWRQSSKLVRWVLPAAVPCLLVPCACSCCRADSCELCLHVNSSNSQQAVRRSCQHLHDRARLQA